MTCVRVKFYGGIILLAAILLVSFLIFFSNENSVQDAQHLDVSRDSNQLAPRANLRDKASSNKIPAAPPPTTRQRELAAASPNDKINIALGKLGDLAKSFAGADLKQQQSNYIAEIASGDYLSSKEKIELCKSVHLAVGDTILTASWSMLLSSAMLSEDFDFSDLLLDIPEGRLGEDFLSIAGSSMSLVGKEITQDELEKLKAVANGKNYQSFLAKYFQSFAKTDPDYAIRLLMKNEGDLGSEGISKVLFYFDSPSSYALIAQSSLINKSLQKRNNQVINSLVSGWGNVAPKTAAEWISNLEDPVVRGEAAETLVERWSSTDLNGTAEWLLSTNLEGMDAAIATFSKTLSRYSPDEARQWAGNIKDESIRSKVLSNIKD